MSKFFDAHTHVQFAAFDVDREAVIKRAHETGVGIVNVGTQIDTSKAAIELANKYPDLWATVGLHPIHTSKSFHDADELGGGEASKGFSSRGEEFDYDAYKKLALDPKVVAIGECGLDYYRLTDDSELITKQKQKAAFEAQIELAKEIEKPLMIHCRNAFPDLISVLKPNTYNLKPSIVHFFSGTKDDAKTLLEMGFSFTFGGVVTFTRDYDEVIKMIPVDRILSETDAPYVSPIPYRGKRNEPVYVVEVVKKLAEIQAREVEEVRNQLLQNAKRIFSIK